MTQYWYHKFNINCNISPWSEQMDKLNDSSSARMGPNCIRLCLDLMTNMHTPIANVMLSPDGMGA